MQTPSDSPGTAATGQPGRTQEPGTPTRQGGMPPHSHACVLKVPCLRCRSSFRGMATIRRRAATRTPHAGLLPARMQGMDPGYCIDVPPGFDDSDDDA